jgi:hypothetical protein
MEPGEKASLRKKDSHPLHRSGKENIRRTAMLLNAQSFEDRKRATLKVLHHNCGCEKIVCIARNASLAGCHRSCRGCPDKTIMTPCSSHARNTGEVRGRIVVSSEYHA